MKRLEGEFDGGLEFDDLLHLVLEALAQVPDFRHRKGRRYPLRGLLGLIVLGLASGLDSLAQIARFGHRREDLRRRLKLRRAPSHATLWRVVTGLAPETLFAALRRIGGEQLVARGAHVVACDGKTSRASRAADGSAAQMVTACLHGSGVVCEAQPVAPGESELRAGRRVVRELLRRHPQVKVVTGDALYADPVLAAEITRHGRDYVCRLKKISLTSSMT
jgi:hypothetical protein